MKHDIEYSETLPLRRIQKGDEVQIIVIDPEPQNPKFLTKKCREIMKIPKGHYKAVCVQESPAWRLQCDKEPLLSGAYTYWGGNKYHMTGIYADELESEQWGKYRLEKYEEIENDGAYTS